MEDNLILLVMWKTKTETNKNNDKNKTKKKSTKNKTKQNKTQKHKTTTTKISNVPIPAKRQKDLKAGKIWKEDHQNHKLFCSHKRPKQIFSL